MIIIDYYSIITITTFFIIITILSNPQHHLLLSFIIIIISILFNLLSHLLLLFYLYLLIQLLYSLNYLFLYITCYLIYYFYRTIIYSIRSSYYFQIVIYSWNKHISSAYFLNSTYVLIPQSVILLHSIIQYPIQSLIYINSLIPQHVLILLCS